MDLSKKDAFLYFSYLSDHFQSIEGFKERWRDIKDHDFSPDELTTILRKTARFPASKDLAPAIRKKIPAFLRQNTRIWEKQAIEKIPGFSAKNLALSLWSFAKLGIEPSAEFMKAWQDRASDVLHTSNAQTLSNSLYAFARLGIAPCEEFMESWAKRAGKILSTFNNQNLANSYWACAVLNVLGHDNQNTAEIFYRKLSGKSLTPAHLRQFAQASLWFDFSFKRSMPEEGCLHSNGEKRLRELFEQTGLTVKDEHIKRLSHDLDYAVEAPKGDILVELDGPSHFVSTGNRTRHYNGGTLLQSALIRKFRGDNVLLRIPFPVSDRLHRKQQQSENVSSLLGRLFARAIGQEPGVYYADYNRRGSDLNLVPLLPAACQPAPAAA